MQVVADHESVFHPKSKPEAEAPQEMTAEEVQVNFSIQCCDVIATAVPTAVATAVATATANCEFT